MNVVTGSALANKQLQRTNTGATQSVIRPLCLLSVFAAEQRVIRHVRQVRGISSEAREGRI